MNENIAVATFNDTKTALQGLKELKQLDDAGNLRVRDAHVVERRPDGTWMFIDGIENPAFGATIGGGLVGALVGVMAGPLGVLLGTSAGLMAGEAVDVTDDERRDLIHEEMIRCVPPGTMALICDVEEPDAQPLNEAMAKLGAKQIKRWPRDEAQAEVTGATEAQDEAAVAAEAGLLEASRTLHRHMLKAKAGLS
jgi:uncharacterized membrane protein